MYEARLRVPFGIPLRQRLPTRLCDFNGVITATAAWQALSLLPGKNSTNEGADTAFTSRDTTFYSFPLSTQAFPPQSWSDIKDGDVRLGGIQF